MRSGSRHFVIVGAGIVGAAAAFFLRQAGAEVTVVEGEAPSAGATGASDGAISVASKRPGLMMEIAQRARDFYAELAASGVLEGLYHSRPTYLIARNERELELVAGQHAALAAASESTSVLDGDEMRRLVPQLSPNVLGALAVHRDGHAIGYEVAQRFLAASGARLLRHRPVISLVIEHSRVRGVLTAEGMVAADAVLVAAGLGSARLLGMPDALLPRRGQLAITDRAVPRGAAIGGHLMSAAYLESKRREPGAGGQLGLVIDPLLTGQFLIGSSREDDVTDRRTDLATISSILREALDLYPPLSARRIVRTFAGIRSATRDGLPIVGPHPDVDGLVVATGFEGDGICLGPLVGSITSDIVLGRMPALDVQPLSPGRFAGSGAMP